MYKELELWYEPVEKLKITWKDEFEKSEMTDFQHAFLGGALKQSRPNKVVEIGVSAGGTTLFVCQCLNMLELKSHVCSVDIEEKWYRNSKYDTGYAIKSYLNIAANHIEHSFYLGVPIPYVIENIGFDIDFLILDTTHVCPGEILDFLICLPFLKNGAMVVLHDTTENHRWGLRSSDVATMLLFNCVHGNKYLMYEEDGIESGLPNIAAFSINEDTLKHIRDCFSMLNMTWEYLPSDKDIDVYREIIHKYYDGFYLDYFDRIVMQQRITSLYKIIQKQYNGKIRFLEKRWKNSKFVVIYGNGYYGKIYYKWAQFKGLHVDAFCISDSKDNESSIVIDLPLYHLSELPYLPDECSIIIAVDRVHEEAVVCELQRKGYYNIL